MEVVYTIAALNEIWKNTRGKSIGFVPTMGALHDGHLSLIYKSIQTVEITICSIFINPAQFNQQSDFDLYPKAVENDLELLRRSGCSVAFLPAVNEIYPDGYKTPTHYPLGNLEEILEGSFRPGHFQGVCLVVDRLVDIIQPDYLFLGQKDYQQCMVINQLLAIVEMNKKPNLVILSTLREQSGLAMSSRNKRLNLDELKKAAYLYQSLLYIANHLYPGNEQVCIESAVQLLLDNGFDKVDYISIADASNLQLIQHWDGKQRIVVLGAAFINQVRLIDNLIVPLEND